MARDKLPERRQNMNERHTIMGTACELSFGFNEDGDIKEVFVTTTKFGTMFDVMARDTCVLLSYLLQHGCAPQQIFDSLTKDEHGVVQGVAGKIVEILMRTQVDIHAIHCSRVHRETITGVLYPFKPLGPDFDI